MSTRHLYRNLERKGLYRPDAYKQMVQKTRNFQVWNVQIKAELKLYHRQFQRYFRMLAGQLEALLQMRDERAAAT